MRGTNLRFIKRFVKHSVALVSVTTWLLVINACASSRDSPPSSRFTPVECEDNDKYFIGTATGRSEDRIEAVKIAKTKALGELSDNIEVRILSVLELANSKFEEDIITISSATVRGARYDTFVTVARGIYIAKVIVTKSKADHLRESVRDLNMPDIDEMILNILKAQAGEKRSP